MNLNLSHLVKRSTLRLGLNVSISYKRKGKPVKTLLQRRLLPAACCQNSSCTSLFFVDTNSIRRDNLRKRKAFLICQVLVSCWRSRVYSCSDAKIRASDVSTDSASPGASLLCVLLQETPAVWQT